MKLIVSAYRDSRQAHQNAMATGLMVYEQQAQQKELELCIGVFKGKREVSCIVRGFLSQYALEEAAQAALTEYEQEAVYTEHKGQATLWEHGRIPGSFKRTPLGTELNTIRAAWQGELPDSYTETLDGRMIVALGGLNAPQ